MPLTIPEQLSIDTEITRRLIDNAMTELNCCKPGIIQSFDGEGTVTVLISVKEKVVQADYSIEDVAFPVLVDVPIIMPRAGGYALKVKPQQGDECLVMFSDLGIDWWWQNGGVQNKTQDLRRHDLSDGFAVLGPWSKPRNMGSFPDGIRMGKEDDSAYVEVNGAEVNIVGVFKINGLPYAAHQHSGVTAGSQATGPVV